MNYGHQYYNNNRCFLVVMSTLYDREVRIFIFKEMYLVYVCVETKSVCDRVHESVYGRM